jgi:hypothetical protein
MKQKKKKKKSTEELTKGVEELQKKKGINGNGKKEFERALGNAVKQHETK